MIAQVIRQKLTVKSKYDNLVLFGAPDKENKAKLDWR